MTKRKTGHSGVWIFVLADVHFTYTLFSRMSRKIFRNPWSFPVNQVWFMGFEYSFDYILGQCVLMLFWFFYSYDIPIGIAVFFLVVVVGGAISWLKFKAKILAFFCCGRQVWYFSHILQLFSCKSQNPSLRVGIIFLTRPNEQQAPYSQRLKVSKKVHSEARHSGAAPRSGTQEPHSGVALSSGTQERHSGATLRWGTHECGT